MADENGDDFFDIAPVKSQTPQQSPWQHGGIFQNGTEDVRFGGASSFPNRYQNFASSATSDGNVHGAFSGPTSCSKTYTKIQGSSTQCENLEEWDPMGVDYSCPTFNCYKNFNVLESPPPPNEMSPQKSYEKQNLPEDISLYVANIPTQMTQEGLRNLFQGAGKVHSCCVLPPSDPSLDRKIGFVTFQSWKEASKAIECYDGFSLGSNSKLRVKVANKKHCYDTGILAKDEEYSSDASGSAQPVANGINGRSNSGGETDRISNVVPKSEVSVTNREQHTVNRRSSDSSKASNSSSPGVSAEQRPCTRCQKLCTQRCSACKAPYCCRECQKADRVNHKAVCTYQGTVKQPAPVRPPSPVKQHSPVRQPSPDDVVNDIDFDCIDISNDVFVSSAKKSTVKDVPEEKVARKNESTGHLGNPIPNTPPESLVIFPPGPPSIQNDCHLLVSTVASGNSFWAQVTDDPGFLRFADVTVKLAEVCEDSLERVTLPGLGMPCLTRFSLDGRWYRSKIEQLTNDDKVKVLFVDYGNKEWKEKHEVYYLPQQFADVYVQARLFTLSCVTLSQNVEVQRSVMEFLDGLVSGKTLACTVVRHVPEDNPEVVVSETGAQESINDIVKAYQEGLQSESRPSPLAGQSYGGLPNTEPSQSYPESSQLYPELSQPHPEPSQPYPQPCQPYPRPSYPNSLTIPQCTQPSGLPQEARPNPTRRPSCDDGFKTYMAANVPSEVLPSSMTFDICVSDFSSPVLFWIQLPETAVDLLNLLSSLLDTTYKDSVFSEYVPIVGELIVAKFTDNLWYRAKVDCIYNDGTLRVTFVDFGNSEDVRLGDVRRIIEELVTIPKLAIKCRLAGVESLSQVGDWSEECVDLCKTLMFNKRCQATTEGHARDCVMLRVEGSYYPSGPVYTVSDELVAKGYAKPSKQEHRDRNVNLDSSAPRSWSSSNQAENIEDQVKNDQLVPADVHLPDESYGHGVAVDRWSSLQINTLKTPGGGTSSSATNQTHNPIVSESGSNPSQPPVINSGSSRGSVSRRPQTPVQQPTDSQSSSNGQRVLPVPTIPPGAFDVVVNDVVSGDEFYAQMIYPQLLCMLHRCVRELNEFCQNTRGEAIHVPTGTFGCAKFSQDNVWYRAQVISLEKDGLLVRFVDFGNTEMIVPKDFRSPPELFYQLPPLALCCRLSSGAGGDAEAWGEQSKDRLLKLTRNKILSCKLVGPASPPYSVTLEHCCGNRRIDLAKEIRKDLPRHRVESSLSLRRGSSGSSAGENNPSVMSELVLTPAIQGAAIGGLGEEYNLLVSHVSHPTYFWAQVGSRANIEELNRLTDDLNAHYNTLSYPPFEVKVNAFCACKFSADNFWYRAFVKSNSPKGFTVHFVDFGNSELTTEAMMRPLETKFMMQPFRALLCSLACVEPLEGKFWSNEAVKHFTNKVSGKLVKCTIVHNSKCRLFVDVQDPDSEMGDSVRIDLLARRFAREVGGYSFSANKAPADQGQSAENSTSGSEQESGGVSYQSVQQNSTSGEFIGCEKSKASKLEGIPQQVEQSLPFVGERCPPSSSFVRATPLPPGNSFSLVQGTSPVAVGQSTLADGTATFVGGNVPPRGSNLNEPKQTVTDRGTPSDSERPMAARFAAVTVDSRNDLLVFVSEVNGPHEIYFQVADRDGAAALKSLFEGLNAQFHNTNQSYVPVVGELCCAQFVVDNCWYRVAVSGVDVNSGLAAVEFLDYGNKADVAFFSIRPIPPSYTQLPFQARQACLAGVNSDDATWTQECRAYLSSKLLSKLVKAKITREIPGILEMELYDISGEEEILINALFTENGYPVEDCRPNPKNTNLLGTGPNAQHDSTTVANENPRRPDLPPSLPVVVPTVTASSEIRPAMPHALMTVPDENQRGPEPLPTISEVMPTVSELEVLVTEVSGPNCFWVQVVDLEMFGHFASMTQQMNSLCESVPGNLPTVKVGDVCCSMFSCDGQWYRARVEAFPGNDLVRVFYLDFGNHEDVEPTTLKPLNHTLTEVPAQALQCTLANIQPAHGVWSGRAIDWLKNRILNKRLFARVVGTSGSVLQLELIDTSNPDSDFFINSELVRMEEGKIA